MKYSTIEWIANCTYIRYTESVKREKTKVSDCNEEYLYWISEVFEDISAKYNQNLNI